MLHLERVGRQRERERERERKEMRDTRCTQICSSEQVFGEVETSSGFFMVPEEVAPEHCKNHNVAGFLWIGTVHKLKTEMKTKPWNGLKMMS